MQSEDHRVLSLSVLAADNIVMVRLSSRTRFGDLHMVLGGGKSDLLTHLARLSVLFEDLRIETFALTAGEEEVRILDQLDVKYRRHYFLRRSTATLFEFCGALQRLSQSPEFQEKAETADQRDLVRRVQDAILFFDANKDRLKNIRNATGAHVLEREIRHAVCKVKETGKIEVVFAQGKGGPKLHYAGNIVAQLFVGALAGSGPRDAEIEAVIR